MFELEDCISSKTTVLVQVSYVHIRLYKNLCFKIFISARLDSNEFTHRDGLIYWYTYSLSIRSVSLRDVCKLTSLAVFTCSNLSVCYSVCQEWQYMAVGLVYDGNFKNLLLLVFIDKHDGRRTTRYVDLQYPFLLYRYLS